jgi:hypothetical protein
MKWKSLRNSWPNDAGNYRVKDCRYNLEGTSKYDGYYFDDPKYEIPPTGSLFLNEYTITHWLEE